MIKLPTVVVGPVRKHPTQGHGFDIINHDGARSFRTCETEDDATAERENFIHGFRHPVTMAKVLTPMSQSEFKRLRETYERA
ncbi:hypothetical protein [Magnetospirillum molischianum]|uniref:Uncharacterized protein n=1 Tax=Magnetospirillum molischianum DSM 120 TaxID=1150626 RepID=H8FXY5_MAGML|nr:hypothetical protein [Magnetospirillum molischianum]CCG43223.1 hypothetical protein PHAMO_80014 [Magnetospirillum molischianum DSM 120]